MSYNHFQIEVNKVEFVFQQQNNEFNRERVHGIPNPCYKSNVNIVPMRQTTII